MFKAVEFGILAASGLVVLGLTFLKPRRAKESKTPPRDPKL